ncbi:substrate-binding domain-containing protein [Streptomyces hirsutus]|uniref:substrate-binding domain-containing protein n=1 Tax=Streptomyces hirsutus TaxID=35620 RepID=UPI00332ADF9B
MDEWLSAENLVAVATALLGVAASVVVVWYERRVPRRKRIGYRVQLETPIGDGASSALPGAGAGSTLVLIRIENDGSEGIARDDYDGPESDGGFGLTAVFGNRTVSSVSVPLTHRSHLVGHLNGRAGRRSLSYEGGTLRIPSVPLNPGEFFKLMVVLSGGAVGDDIELTGGLSGGEVHRNRSTTLDAKPPLFSGVSRTITILLTASVLMLAGIVFSEEEDRGPIGCEGGTLTVTGSTAFEPVLKEVAEEYRRDCAEAGPEIDVDPHGSTAGIRELVAAGREAKEGSPPMVALSDGPKPDGLPELRENPVAVSLFTLVVNKGVGVKNLSTADVRRLYRGEITNWSELGGSDVPVRLVSRDANSGTRQVLQRQVLGRGETANSSVDCRTKDDSTAPVLRCELDSTDLVLRTVAELPGSLGYSEFNRAAGQDVTRLSLDGRVPSVDDLQHGDHTYSFREVEYAYTYGQPPTNSLASSFLMYLTRTVGQGVIRTHGHLPCHGPGVERLCADPGL